jgi:hypothetical protein
LLILATKISLWKVEGFVEIVMVEMVVEVVVVAAMVVEGPHKDKSLPKSLEKIVKF